MNAEWFGEWFGLAKVKFVTPCQSSLHLAGVEPATFGSVDRRSIQLS